VGADHADGPGVERDVAFAGLGLGRTLAGFPAELGDLPADRGDRGAQIGVGRAQLAGLAAVAARQQRRAPPVPSTCPCQSHRRNWHRAASPCECSAVLGRYRGQVSSLQVPSGVAHKLPADLRNALIANPAALDAWKDITPLARNEFICWVEDAKQEMTRERRIRRTQEELEEGQRRPCCWPGCKHRERTGK